MGKFQKGVVLAPPSNINSTGNMVATIPPVNVIVMPTQQQQQAQFVAPPPTLSESLSFHSFRSEPNSVRFVDPSLLANTASSSPQAPPLTTTVVVGDDSPPLSAPVPTTVAPSATQQQNTRTDDSERLDNCLPNCCIQAALRELAQVKRVGWRQHSNTRTTTTIRGTKREVDSAVQSAEINNACGNLFAGIAQVYGAFKITSIWGLLKHPGFWIVALILNIAIVGYNTFTELFVYMEQGQTQSIPFFLMLLPVIVTGLAYVAVVLWLPFVFKCPGTWLGTLMCANTFFLIMYVPILCTQYNNKYLWYGIPAGISCIICCVPCYRMYHDAFMQNQSDFAKLVHNNPQTTLTVTRSSIV